MHSWNPFGAWTSHRQTRIHKTHHNPNLGKPPPSPLQYILCLATGPAPKCCFVPGLPSESPEILKVGTLATLEAHNFVCRPLIEMKFKSKLQLSKGMWQATCMQGNRDNSRLLMIGNQIANLTLDPSFGHNLCLKCPNGSCEPILNIYIPKDF